mgnify:CR=1 FL=1|jgi:hypothetical protein
MTKWEAIGMNVCSLRWNDTADYIMALRGFPTLIQLVPFLP